MNKIDLTGQKFGRLTVLKDSGQREKSGDVKWLCLCDCGNTVIVNVQNLKRGNNISCGCYQRELTQFNKKYNTYELYDTYGIGYTSNTNQIFCFDLEDYESIKSYCWFESDEGYIKCNISKLDNTKKGHMSLHRHILKPKQHEIIDHINRDKKDNRKINLRIVTRQQNCMNRGCNKNNILQIKGVSLEKNGRYRATICVNGKNVYLGIFKDIEDAKFVRQQAEEKYFGKYAYKESE